MMTLDKLKQALQKKLPPATPRSVWTNPIHFITCGFGIGTFPIMPGTIATLFSIVIYSMLASLHWYSYLFIVVFLNALGVWLCGKTNHDFGCDDHVAACYDEIAAFLICFIGLPFSWTYILIGFVLFRFLDIVKPSFIGYIDKNIHGGLGVMLDDIVAAICTLVALQLIHFFTG